jgi:uncharacterized membrane protein YedE/YeeE
MPSVLAALVSGLLFGPGLAVSQMINAAKVIAFIDVFGAFDPSLVLVMATAGDGARLCSRSTPQFAGLCSWFRFAHPDPD